MREHTLNVGDELVFGGQIRLTLVGINGQEILVTVAAVKPEPAHSTLDGESEDRLPPVECDG